MRQQRMCWRRLFGLWRGFCLMRARMPAHSRRWGWRISAALFGAILIALVIAALLLDPLTASVP